VGYSIELKSNLESGGVYSSPSPLFLIHYSRQK
jgi:hypothetical protein